MTLEYREHALHLDGVSLVGLAGEFGTPLYVTSQAALRRAASELDAALAGPTPHLICYAVKANPTLAVIQTFAQMGMGADVTSGGELYRALRAGVPAEKIVYSGVGKTPGEMRQALEANIRALHVESEDEVHTLAGVAGDMGQVARVALRVNPEVDPRTHPHIATGQRDSKFGVARGQVEAVVGLVRDRPALQLCGLSMHIGSQITDLEPFRQAAGQVVALARRLIEEGDALEYVDLGGGLGVRYRDEERPPVIGEWAGVLRDAMGDLPLMLLVEPGRALVAEASVLLMRVLAIKRAASKTFVVVDAGMNDFLRPVLYEAHHPIWAVERGEDRPERRVDVVGPVCESTDVIARGRMMRLPRRGDLLAVLKVGAYGISMASNYNSRLRPAEVMIGEDGQVRLIRERERQADLVRQERLLR